MSKLKIQDLKVESFITADQDVKGGATAFCTRMTCGPATCAQYCGPTDGVHICKEI